MYPPHLGQTQLIIEEMILSFASAAVSSLMFMLAAGSPSLS